jgi:hypothetical protein
MENAAKQMRHLLRRGLAGLRAHHRPFRLIVLLRI